MKEQTPSEWAIAMLEMMSPAMRKRLLRKIAVTLRLSNARRIRAQSSPDGEPWERRKTRRKGKRKMLTGFAKSTHLKARSSDTSAEIGFSRGAARLAQIHHFGMLDNVSKSHDHKVQYPARPLLGLTDKDADLIDSAITEYYSNV